MKTIEIKLYEFSELSKEIQEKVIQNNYDINVNYDWWENTYYDAKNIGLKIDGFDLDRNKHATGDFIDNYYDCASAVVKEHGKECTTYVLAYNFLKEHAKVEELIGDNTNPFNSDVAKAEDMEADFLRDLLQEYANILQNEYEYLTSREAVIETIEANGYTFEENGTMRNN